jgi:hypothetical protein
MRHSARRERGSEAHRSRASDDDRVAGGPLQEEELRRNNPSPALRGGDGLKDATESGDGLPTQEDYDAIAQSIQDYVGGWYDGDAERMRRCLHPELVKRTIVKGASPGTWQLRRPSTFDGMVEATRKGGGTEVPAAERRYQIDVLHVFRHVATARCVSPQYVDYLHLAKFGEKRWLIVHALWELREGALEPPA